MVAAFAGENLSESAAGFVVAETAASSVFLVGTVTKKHDSIIKMWFIYQKVFFFNLMPLFTFWLNQKLSVLPLLTFLKKLFKN